MNQVSLFLLSRRCVYGSVLVALGVVLLVVIVVVAVVVVLVLVAVVIVCRSSQSVRFVSTVGVFVLRPAHDKR